MPKLKKIEKNKNSDIGNNNGVPKRSAKRIVRRIVIIMGAVIIIFSAVSMSIVVILYSVAFPRYDRPAAGTELCFSDVSDLYPCERIYFSSGKNRLAGYIYGSDNTGGLVVVAHGMGKGADSYLAQILYFVDRGWQVFAFDFTGSYESEGASIGGFAQGIYDVDAALDYIESEARFDGLPVVLFGHSWGGYSVCSVSAYEKHDIAAIVAVSALNSSEEIIFHYTHKYINAYTYTQIPFLRVYEGIAFGPVATITATDGINAANVPVMLIHSEEDEVVPFKLSVIARAENINNDKVICEIARRTHTGLLYEGSAESLRLSLSAGNSLPKGKNLFDANLVNLELMDKINNFMLSSIAE